MTVERARELLSTVTAVLGTAPRSHASLLDDIGWPREVEARFFASKGTELPEVTYEVDRKALEEESAALGAAARTIEGDEPIPVWLRAVVASAIDRNRLLLAAGTKAFGDISREIYGGASSTFPGLRTKNSDLADHVLERLRVHGWDEATDREEVSLDARAFAAELERRIARHRPEIALTVAIDDTCTSKAIAGMTKVRIRSDATFRPWEAEGLFHHEIETHAFSAHNGAGQRLAPFLRAGGPRSTPTQEGLAVFAELYTNNLAAPRLERLARRVKLVEMAENGASFIDLYSWLIQAGAAEHDAFLDAARVFRGGLPAGGAPFTKDASYLAGLVHVYVFLQAFVRGGFRDEVEMIMAGRIALDDITALVELRAMGLLDRPRHRPRWLRGWSTLLPYFAFSSFLQGLDLGEVEARYQACIALAEAAAPKRA